jgi:hypothetical protein
MASFQQLLVDPTIPLGKLELGAEVFLRLPLLQCLFLLQVGPGNGIEVAVGSGTPSDGGGRGAMKLSRRLFEDTCYGFCVRDVSLALLQR